MLQTQPLMGLISAGCNSDIVRSGHIELDTLWASNEVKVASCAYFIKRPHNIVKDFFICPYILRFNILYFCSVNLNNI